MSENIADRLLSHIEKLFLKITFLEQELLLLRLDNALQKNKLEHEIKRRKAMENNWF